jgi:hypothetical protein
LSDVAEGGYLDPKTQFKQLYDQEYVSVYRAIRAVVLDSAAAEDLTQETFVRATAPAAATRPRRRQALGSAGSASTSPSRTSGARSSPVSCPRVFMWRPTAATTTALRLATS